MIPTLLPPISLQPLIRIASRQKVALFTRQLRRLIASGVPEAEAVRAILNSMPEGRFGRALRRRLNNLGFKTVVRLFWRFPRVLKQLLTRLESGFRLSEALRAFPNYFPPSYVSIIAAGEQSDDLPGAVPLALDTLRHHEGRMDRFFLGVTAALVGAAFCFALYRFLDLYILVKK